MISSIFFSSIPYVATTSVLDVVGLAADRDLIDDRHDRRVDRPVLRDRGLTRGAARAEQVDLAFPGPHGGDRDRDRTVRVAVDVAGAHDEELLPFERGLLAARDERADDLAEDHELGPILSAVAAGATERQHRGDVRVRARDHVDRDDLANALRGALAGLGRRLDGRDIATDDRGDVAAAGLLVADELDLGSLAHGVGRLAHADETYDFDHSKRVSHLESPSDRQTSRALSR